MAFKYTEEQLNKLDKELLIHLFLGMQEQMEQLILSKKNRFGRSSEKMSDPEQICFMEIDGTIVFFNEAEAVCDLDAPEPDDLRRYRGQIPTVSEALMLSTKHYLSISNGSACNSNSYKPSYVLSAMGIPEEKIYDSVRISWGPQSDEEEIKEAIKRIAGMASSLAF